MSQPYVNVVVRTVEGVESPLLCVHYADGKETTHPLTDDGCRQAGRELFAGKFESWLCSSGVDHADEVGYDGDVRELMAAGHDEEWDEADKPRKEVVGKLMEYGANPAFQAGLTQPQRDAFEAMRQNRDQS